MRASCSPIEAVREELAASISDARSEQEFYERANNVTDSAFDAYDELATRGERSR